MDHERLTTAAQLAGLAVGIAAVMTLIIVVLGFYSLNVSRIPPV
jgi:hypothetical protein